MHQPSYVLKGTDAGSKTPNANTAGGSESTGGTPNTPVVEPSGENEDPPSTESTEPDNAPPEQHDALSSTRSKTKPSRGGAKALLDPPDDKFSARYVLLSILLHY